MNREQSSENFVLALGAGIMSVMLLYAIGADVFRLDRSGCRVLAGTALAIGAIAAAIRYVRLRRLGIRPSFFQPPEIPAADRGKFFLWVVGAAALGAYSCWELFVGGFWLGTLGIAASLSSMLVLTRGLLLQATR